MHNRPRRCIASWLAVLASLWLVLFSSHATAQPTEKPDVRGAETEQGGAVAGELGFGQVDEDFFLTARLHLGLQLPAPAVVCTGEEEPPCFTRFRFGVQAPLRFRVIDDEPETDAIIREEDWDQVSDYFRILRYVEYGYPHEPLHARLGELGSVVVGHGTIMNGYYNVVTSDTYQFGVHGNVNTLYGGLQLMLDNVADPDIFGGRAYVRPWGFIDPESWLHRLAIGVSVVTDIDAPERLSTDANGEIVVGPDSAPAVAEDSHATVVGFDTEVSVLDGPVVSLVPYTDLNILVGQGPGWHLGTLFSLRPLDSLSIATRAEFRWLGENYLPDYFGPIYEIDRFQFSGWGQALPAPKLRVAASQDRDSLPGAYGSVTANVLGIVAGSIAYADYEGPDNGSMWLRLSVTPPGPVQVGAFYYKQNFADFGEAFDLDGALGVAEARVGVVGPLYLHGQYSRLWRLHDDGRYETINDWNVGVGARFEF